MGEERKKALQGREFPTVCTVSGVLLQADNIFVQNIRWTHFIHLFTFISITLTFQAEYSRTLVSRCDIWQVLLPYPFYEQTPVLTNNGREFEFRL